MEQEFFVQLFVEHDPNLRLPTVGILLRKMFPEQHISFTKVLYTVDSDCFNGLKIILFRFPQSFCFKFLGLEESSKHTRGLFQS